MVGDKIRFARKSRNFTQKYLADGLGITPSAITQIEQGLTTPDINRVIEIAELLQMTVGELLEGKTEKIKPTLRPLIGAASCGVPVTYYYDDVEMVEAPNDSGKNSYYIRADGDSMHPDIKNGSLILCDPDVTIESGDIVHFEWDGEYGIKKFIQQGNARMMVPINTDYSPILITDEYELRMTKCIKMVSDL